MHNNGTIAFTLLPVIALVLCGAALFAFLNLDGSIGDKSQEFARLSSELNIMRQYIESSAKVIVSDYAKTEATAEALQASAEKHNLHIQGQGNFFTKIEQGEFRISRSGNLILLEIDGVFLQSRQGQHLGKSAFNLVLEADAKGEFIRFINK